MTNVSKTKELLKVVLSNNNTRLTPLITGGAGVGKTQLVEQVAKELGMTLAYVNLADRQPGEFAINYVDSKDNLGTVIDSIFDADLVFFDELNRAELVMSEIMNIMQSHSVRGVELNCKFVCAMNVGGKYSVSTLDPAQQGRFITFDLRPDYKEWSTFMRAKHVDADSLELSSVLSFIAKHNVLNTEDDIVTPRSWDELVTLGVSMAPYVLPSNIAVDLANHMENVSFPDYDKASQDNWVPVYAERDYVLGAVGQVTPKRLVQLMMLMSIDSIASTLTEICDIDPKAHEFITRDDDTLAKYLASVSA